MRDRSKYLHSYFHNFQGADHNSYKQFVPSYEIPLQAREIVIVNEDAPRGAGSTDFSTPMNFMMQRRPYETHSVGSRTHSSQSKNVRLESQSVTLECPTANWNAEQTHPVSS